MSKDQFEITSQGMRFQHKKFAAKRLKVGEEWIPGLTVELDVSGGMGIVYVLRTRGDKRYILKTYDDRMLSTGEIAARFFNETELLLSLENHDNIVKAEAIVAWGSVPCVLLEYFDGKTLRTKLDEGKLKVLDSLRLALQLCDGMVYVGDTKHIVHRDIKPENLLVDQNGKLKIIDFGLAKISLSSALEATDDNRSVVKMNGTINVNSKYAPLPPTDWRVTRLKQVIGTPDYAAPEVFERADNASIHSDIYSTGLVIAEMLTGKRIREGLTLKEKRAGKRDWSIAEQQQTEKGIPKSIQKIIYRCLDDYPNKRFRSFGELRKALNDEYKIITGSSFPSGHIRPRSSIEAANLSASLSKLGRYEEALTVLDRALKKDPSNAICLNHLAMCQFALNRQNEALSTIDRACLAATDPYTRSLVLRGKAHLFTGLKDYKKALLCLDTAIDAKSDDSETWALKANALRQLKQIDKAIVCLEKSLVLSDTNESVWAVLGECYREREEYEKASTCFERALKLRPDWTEVAVNQALCLAISNKLKEARNMLFELYKKNPTAPEVRIALDSLCTDREKSVNEVQTLITKGEFDKAIKVADEILKCNEDDATIWHNRGIAMETLGKYNDALHSYNKSLRLRSDDDNVYVNKGNVIDKMGQPKEALCSYDAALALNPHNVGALTNKAVCLLKLSRTSEAIECCEKAIQLDPDSYMGWRTLGIVLHKNQKYTESRICLENALRINPHDTVALTMKAECEMAIALHEEALESLAAALELEPESWRSWANVAQAMKTMGKKEDAIIYLKKAAEQSKTDPELWAQLGALVFDYATGSLKTSGSVNIAWLHDSVEYMKLASQYDHNGRYDTLIAQVHEMIPLMWKHVIEQTFKIAASGHSKEALQVANLEEKKLRRSGKKLMLALALANQAILLAHGMNRHDDARFKVEEARKLAKQTGPKETVDIIEQVLQSIL